MPDADGAILGIGTALSITPGPPSIGVLSTMVAITKVTASVSTANSSPSSARTRKMMAPSTTPNSAGTAAANGKVQRSDQPNLVPSTAVVYTPMPKNASGHNIM